MRMTRIALAASALLCGGCWTSIPQQHALADPNIPHRLAKPADLDVYVRRPDGQLVVERQHVDAGWWVASPQIIEQPAGPKDPP